MTSLGPALDKLEHLLTTANGDYVPGQTLASATGVPMIALSNFIGQLRSKRPGLIIEGKRGKGYRLAQAPPPASKTGPKPDDSCLTTNQRAAATLSMLDMLQPKTAELVKTIALESGETAQNCIARLIAYGAEVHHSLVGDGENPVGLVTPREAAPGKQATRH
jgi:biotin operon repressor